jgi:hypothetical protein
MDVDVMRAKDGARWCGWVWVGGCRWEDHTTLSSLILRKRSLGPLLRRVGSFRHDSSDGANDVGSTPPPCR